MRNESDNRGKPVHSFESMTKVKATVVRNEVESLKKKNVLFDCDQSDCVSAIGLGLLPIPLHHRHVRPGYGDTTQPD